MKNNLSKPVIVLLLCLLPFIFLYGGCGKGNLDNTTLSTTTQPTVSPTISSTTQTEEPVYQLTVYVSAPEWGRVTQSSSPDPKGFHYGDMVMLTATPEEGYVFDGWGVNGASTEDIYNPVLKHELRTCKLQHIYRILYNRDYDEQDTGQFHYDILTAQV